MIKKIGQACIENSDGRLDFELDVVVLAAGKGSRMRSDLPKVLQPIGGAPILTRVLAAARALQPQRIVVVYNDELLPKSIIDDDLIWVLQERRLGTGQAAWLALQYLAQQLAYQPTTRKVLILCADLPLLSGESLMAFCRQGAECDLAVCSFCAPNPTGFGRIIKSCDQQQLLAIVEEADADDRQRQITEVNSGVIMANEELLLQLLPALTNTNQQGEYYLTDAVAAAIATGARVRSVLAERAEDFMGVNDLTQLAQAERILQDQQARYLQRECGVRLLDPARFDLRGTLTVGKNVVIDVDVVIEGEVVLGDNVKIGPFCHLKDVIVEDDVTILSHSSLDGARLASGSQIGPFARLRPGSSIGRDARIGNFVEVKNSEIGNGSKVSHLSYIGDAELGAQVNVGAGTITCNYDGQYKSRTVIGDQVFIGSNSALVAPVTLGDGVTVGAGSVIVRDVEAGQLALARAQQVAVAGWQPKRAKQHQPTEQSGQCCCLERTKEGD